MLIITKRYVHTTIKLIIGSKVWTSQKLYLRTYSSFEPLKVNVCELNIGPIRPFSLRFNVINFRALLPHMYGDINKLFQCFVELVFFYFSFAHNIYSKLQHCFNIFKPSQSRALQYISEFSQ